MSKDLDFDGDLLDFLDQYNHNEIEKFITDIPLSYVNRDYILGIEFYFDDGSSEYIKGSHLLCDVDLRKDIYFDVLEGFPKPVNFKIIINTKKISQTVESFLSEIDVFNR